MAIGSRKVRLPELPIFRKFSLALRQEFARAEDVLQALEDSRRQVRAMIEEGSPSLGPGLRRSGRAEAGRPRRGLQAPEDEDLAEEESPESFLKDSVAEASPARQAGRRDRRSSPDHTVAMRPADDEPASSGAPSSPLPEAARASSERQKPESPAAEKKRPAKRPSRKAAAARTSRKRPAGKTSSKDAADGSPAEEEGPEPAAEQPGSTEEAPAAAVSAAAGEEPDEGSPDDVERDFWGEERQWGKGRRGRPGRSSRVGIVRVGAEGRPVGDGEAPAPEANE